VTERVIRVAIALGSNLGDRASHLSFAVERLRTALRDFRVSSFIDTNPVGVGPQPVFLNGAVTGSTELSARQLLEWLLALERERGRHRPFEGAPRTLDLDLVLYGTAIIDEPGLTVPHPRFRDRAFVLAPLTEIAGEMQDPVSGLTVRDLWERIRPVQRGTPVAPGDIAKGPIANRTQEGET
jgi:2-amino-4-hydroxy-6-hydroxymethyldihydropteridine diphosphokinase